ncbi:pyridine nucleotide-disulfide oxidoreductase-domain-containing protein [Glomus cerebriforme]|uniref:Pyridine nucleotide-disulfide oxidoreductase-domain-containing protein n=1 Tax=Glomus cerebriforme TaxID=658196 RepID=A0A397TSQ2_9GLOM|nr:pyridine nucleotide-disulfide oxidoreductase-domain-containing protein [Glomus cerebriforme]
MLRNLTKSKCLRTHCLRNKLVASHGTLPLLHRLHFSGQVQQTYLFNVSNANYNSLHKYPNISRKFISTEAEKVTTESSKFGRKLVIASSLVLGAAVVFATLDYKHAESKAKEYENKESPSILKRGGPKNLPIATHLIDERDFDINKPRLVILGSGWGAISVIKGLEKDKYHITVISPQNYFLFTPLLPSATVGTLETRSLLEPVRSLIKGISAHFLEAKATDICFNDKLIELSPVDESSEPFYVPYDKLVIAVGSLSNTFGIEGMEYCHFLKTINDARKIRKKIMDNFEKASLPTTPPKERKSLLSFVVCGGGPTGVEFAAELYDFLTEDVVRYFPSILRNEVQVSIIQGQDHILNTYDAKISDFAEKKFRRDNINVVTNARVQKIEPNHIIYKMKKSEDVKELDYGLVLWSTGIDMNPLTKTISEKLEDQKNTRALITDNRLRLKGVSDSSVYAIGDCSTIENPKLVQQLMQFFIDADKDKNGRLSYNEFQALAKKIGRRYPITKSYLKKADTLFARYDQDKSGTLELEELRTMFEDIDKKLTSLPATAQVAYQQGKYLGKKLNQIATAQKTKIFPPPSDYSVNTDNPESDVDDLLPPFSYAHFGSLAYIGNAAVADFGTGWTWMGGLPAVYLWRSVYFSEQVSFRTRALLALDWSKRCLFGRDISKF